MAANKNTQGGRGWAEEGARCVTIPQNERLRSKNEREESIEDRCNAKRTARERFTHDVSQFPPPVRNL